MVSTIPRKSFPRQLETKANHSCDSYFQKCSEEYRFVSFVETTCNNNINIMHIIFVVFSANIEMTQLMMNK